MAAGAKRSKAKWDSEAERKIIDIWADILEEFSWKMLTQKKEAIATVRMNEYINKELNRSEQYSEKAFCNKIDSIMKKGKQMYIAYQRKTRHGRSTHRNRSTWTWKLRNLHDPILKTIQHWAQGPVDDSAVTPPNVATEVVVPDEQEDGDDSYTPEATRCPSRASNKSTPAVASDDDYEEDEENPPKKEHKRRNTPSC